MNIETSSVACARIAGLTGGGFGTRRATVLFFFFFFALDLFALELVERFVGEV
jgi:hypothetical protein